MTMSEIINLQDEARNFREECKCIRCGEPRCLDRDYDELFDQFAAGFKEFRAIMAAIRDSFPHFSAADDITPDKLREVGRELRAHRAGVASQKETT